MTPNARNTAARAPSANNASKPGVEFELLVGELARATFVALGLAALDDCVAVAVGFGVAVAVAFIVAFTVGFAVAVGVAVGHAGGLHTLHGW
jgi:hypothetical protein